MTNAVAPVVRLIKDHGAVIKDAVTAGRGTTETEFLSGLKAAARVVPDLQECIDVNPQSVVESLEQCALLGLSPAPALRHFHLIPRRIFSKALKRKVLTCTTIIGYRGFVHMAMSSGLLDDIGAEVVFKGEQFTELRRGEFEHSKSHDIRGDDPGWGDILLAYAWAEVKGRARPVLRVMYHRDIAKRRACAQTDSMWSEWPVEQCHKTVIRAMLGSGLVPLGDRVVAAMDAEQTPDEELRTIPADEVEELEAPDIEAQAEAQAPQLSITFTTVEHLVERVNGCKDLTELESLLGAAEVDFHDSLMTRAEWNGVLDRASERRHEIGGL